MITKNSAPYHTQLVKIHKKMLYNQRVGCLWDNYFGIINTLLLQCWIVLQDDRKATQGIQGPNTVCVLVTNRLKVAIVVMY